MPSSTITHRFSPGISRSAFFLSICCAIAGAAHATDQRTGALVGGAIGATGGAVIGHQAGGTTGAVVGAAVGAGVGAAIGAAVSDGHSGTHGTTGHMPGTAVIVPGGPAPAVIVPNQGGTYGHDCPPGLRKHGCEPPGHGRGHGHRH